jgi:large subunit ribosomal protein L2
MAIVKVKPTSPGRRAMVKVVNKNLHQGKPFAALLDSQSSTAGRNNNGRITTRHKGGGHKQHYRIVDFRRTKDGVSSTTRTVARTSRWCSTQTANVATSSPRRA